MVLKMHINKAQLLAYISDCLQDRLNVAKGAAMQAYQQATAKESVAENKYDTFGLEASYLAHGQARRVAECEEDVARFKLLSVKYDVPSDSVKMGALLCLLDDNDVRQWLFLSPVAGGMKLSFQKKGIVLISPESPLGCALLGKAVDDEVVVNLAGQKKYYEITALQ